MRTILVISPHLDDATIGAGQLLAGRRDAHVATVFAGTPKARTVSTTYDRSCGFDNAEQAVQARREEDSEALALLAAHPHHLGFVDSQYGEPDKRREHITAAIVALIEELDPEYIVGPLGLLHQDHELVREAVLDATSDLQTPLWLYEDLPYRVTDPETVPKALEAVRKRGLTAELGFLGDGPLERKITALWAYRSQIGLFPNYHTLLCPERFWKVDKI